MIKLKYIKVNYQKKSSEGSGDATKNDMLYMYILHSLGLKKICVLPLKCRKKLGSVGRKIFLFFYNCVLK